MKQNANAVERTSYLKHALHVFQLLLGAERMTLLDVLRHSGVEPGVEDSGVPAEPLLYLNVLLQLVVILLRQRHDLRPPDVIRKAHQSPGKQQRKTIRAFIRITGDFKHIRTELF